MTEPTTAAAPSGTSGRSCSTCRWAYVEYGKPGTICMYFATKRVPAWLGAKASVPTIRPPVEWECETWKAR